jgi:hypothetical protein
MQLQPRAAPALARFLFLDIDIQKERLATAISGARVAMV